MARREFGQVFWWFLAVAIALAPVAFPQSQAQGMGLGLPPVEGAPGGNGFGFYGLAGYFGYTSTAVPFNATLLNPALNLGPNYLAGGRASAGWHNIGPRTDASIVYTISYDASIRYSSWNSINHYLTFGVSHELTPRLTYSLSGTAVTMRWDQFLFAPTLLGEVAGAGATYDDLVSAILNGKYTNSQLASILTGAPLLESPAATLLYGTRFFTSSLRSQLAYDLSARTHAHAGVGGSRIQHLNSNLAQDGGTYLVPTTTTANAMAGISYDLSPVTEIGVEAQANRTFSRFEDAYITNGVVTADRAVGRHWILEGRGGAGTFTPVRQTFAFKSGPHYVAGGNIIYKAYSNTFIASFLHTIADTSGIAAQSANAASGVWQWHRPGQQWAVFSQGRYEKLTGSTLSNIDAWLSGAGIERMLDRHVTIRAAYIYGRTTGVVSNALASRQLEGVNLVFSWSPQPLGF
jgi:hypothetical protein